MHLLPEYNRNILIKNIRYYKDLQFPGRGSGVRLAEEIGVPPQTVSNWLNGKRLPTFSQLWSLSQAFGVSPLELCGIRRSRNMRKATPISVFTALLKRHEELAKRHADPRIRQKFMKKIKNMIGKELESDIE